MSYVIRNVVCDYEVFDTNTGKSVCICNIRRNAELIKDILDADSGSPCAYAYDLYPYAKYKVVKQEGE